MIVRQADKSELMKAFTLFTAFESCSEFVKVVPEICVENYTRFIESGAGGILLAIESDEIVGGLGYLTFNDIHDGTKYAVETFWIMLPEHRGKGIKLLEAFEGIAGDQSCDGCAMIHLEDSFPEKLTTVYKRRGYRLIERHFVKRLKL